MKKTIALALAALMLLALLTACAAKPAETKPTESSASDAAETPEQTPTPETTETAPTEEETPAEPGQPAEPALPDGVYTAEFNTDSSMFHANEACDGKGTLVVQDGTMTIHVSLASTSILNLFPGTAEDAQKEGAELLQPTTDTVTYSVFDGELDATDVFVSLISQKYGKTNAKEYLAKRKDMSYNEDEVQKSQIPSGLCG